MPRSLPRVLLVTGLLCGALAGAASAQIGYCRRPFYRGGLGYRMTSFGYGGYGYGGFGYGAFHTPSWAYMDAGPSLSDEDIYLGSKEKGDRHYRRGVYSKAAREYGNAYRRAVKLFGRKTQKARDARSLREKAQEMYRRYGDADPRRSFWRAQEKGHRAMDRGDWDKAVAQYEDAMKRAHTDEQAKQAVEALVRAKAAREGRPVARKAGASVQLAAQGDEAMARGDFRAAVGQYASALTRSLKRHGADSARTREITAKLTKAQEAVTLGAQRRLDVGYAE